MKKIAIIGSGAVGCYYGGMLAYSGQDVRFVMRSDLSAVRQHGLRIHTRGQTIELPHVKAYASSQEVGPCDLIIIALKTTANHALEHLLPPLLGPDTVLLTLQNGLGNEDFLAQGWGAERVMGALCFVCINRREPGVVDHLDHGSISVGEFQGLPQARTRWIVDAFLAAGIDAKAVASLAAERWRKLVWNIPFNGLSICAGGAMVADILAVDSLRTLARDLMRETCQAARKLGHDVSEEFADFQISRSYSMGAYKPSSMIDWELGRPVEVEAIWGEPWRQGTAVGVNMTRLETLYRLLQHLTSHAQVRS